jgi:hypothetical protein
MRCAAVGRCVLVVSLWVSLPTPLRADSPPVAVPSSTPTGSSHAYDPCAMISQQDVASAAGVAANQVFVPQKPTENECVWAIGNKAGTPGQQVALTVQTVSQVQQAHGMARFGAILSAVQNIPGAPIPQSPVVQHAFADAQIVVGLGDKAGWKNGTLSVLKNETLLQVNATGQATDSESLTVCKSVAKSALTNINTTTP